MYNYDEFLYGLSGALMVFVIFIFLAIIAVRILFLLNLHKTLQSVSYENRTMDSGLVWLALIPIFAWVWHFIIVTRIGDSLKAEFETLDIPMNEERPSYNIGLTYSILTVCSIIPFLGGLAGLVGFVFMIIYWVKTAEYKNILLKRNSTVI